jgi:3-hydroxyisobutyrate dehydrogenase-like beta-hydroxyacid dehydrogenase
MGGAMVARLRAAGHEVSVYNRTAARARALADATGATVAASAGAAVSDVDVVLVSLADDAALDSVYPGLVSGLAAGTVVVETSTVAPATVRRLAHQVGQRSAALLDAPVSGSVPVVERGELTFLVGGDPGALDKVRPVLGALGTRVFHLGDVGAGATMKLAVNSIVHGLNQALAEALVLAEKAGVDRAAAYEVFAASVVAAPFVAYKRTAYERPDEAPVAFSLDLVAKDLVLVDTLAAEVGASMPQAAANRAVVEQAVRAGLGGADMSALAALLRDRRGGPAGPGRPDRPGPPR